MYLTFGGDIKLDTFEIKSDCSSGFYHNVKVHERNQRKLFSNHYYHEYKGKQVIGYICDDKPPQSTNLSLRGK